MTVAIEQGGPDVVAVVCEFDEESGSIVRRCVAGGERGPVGRAGFARDVDGAVGADSHGAGGIGVDTAEVVTPQDGAVSGELDHEGVEVADQVGAVTGGADGVAGDVADLVREGRVADGVDATVRRNGHGVEAVGARIVSDRPVCPKDAAVCRVEGSDQCVGADIARAALRVADSKEVCLRKT